jgi:hypothetical protein
MDNVKLFHFIVVALSGWVNRHQQAIIDYPTEEIGFSNNNSKFVDFDYLATIGDAWL